MEDREQTKILEKHIAKIERYQGIVEYYKRDPSRVGHNRKPLSEIQNDLFNLSPIYLNVRHEKGISEDIDVLVSANQEDLSKLLLLDLDLESLLCAPAVNRAQGAQ